MNTVSIEIVANDSETFRTLLGQSLAVMNTAVKQRKSVNVTVDAKGARKGNATITVKTG